jgi:hypothetical protein
VCCCAVGAWLTSWIASGVAEGESDVGGDDWAELPAGVLLVVTGAVVTCGVVVSLAMSCCALVAAVAAEDAALLGATEGVGFGLEVVVCGATECAGVDCARGALEALCAGADPVAIDGEVGAVGVDAAGRTDAGEKLGPLEDAKTQASTLPATGW